MFMLMGRIREGEASRERRRDRGDSLEKFVCAEKGEREVWEELSSEKLVWMIQALSILRCLESTHRKKLAEYFL